MKAGKNVATIRRQAQFAKSDELLMLIEQAGAAQRAKYDAELVYERLRREILARLRLRGLTRVQSEHYLAEIAQIQRSEVRPEDLAQVAPLEEVLKACRITLDDATRIAGAHGVPVPLRHGIVEQLRIKKIAD